MLSDETILEISRYIGIIGLSLFVLSGIGGVLMASRAVQQINIIWLRGKMFGYHRLLSLIGFGLIILHPLILTFATKATGGMNLVHILVPFTSPKETLLTGIGTIAFYFLLLAAISSIFIKYLKRKLWRALHYATYLVIFLGLIHGLFISGELDEAEVFDFDEPEKVILIILAMIALALPIWRLFLAEKYLTKKKVSELL